MRIIINCDDLGADAEVNESIFSLMTERRVTSATLMMNGPAIDDAVRRLSQFPYCSFGVHLNATEYAPLSGHPGLKELLNSAGEFAGNATASPIRIPLNSQTREGIYTEWCAQIERALGMGVPVSHLDSHHHVHTRLSLLGVLWRVQTRFGIRRIRLRRNIVGLPKTLRKRLGIARQLPWNLALRHSMPVRTTDGFASFTVFHERLLAGYHLNGSIELMCHPGRDRFARETELLRGPWRQIPGLDAQMISYNDL